MGKTILAEGSLLNKLTELSEKQGYTTGLIIGQPTVKKNFVIHLTETPTLKDENETSTGDQITKEFEHIEDSWLKVHMKNVTRSLPGGIYVLGIFIVGPKDIFNDKVGLQKIRSMITNLISSSKANEYLYGNNFLNSKVVLHFNSLSKRYQCKSFDEYNLSLSSSPVQWKFMDNPMNWYKIETNYLMNRLLPYYYPNKNNPKLKKLTKDLLAYYKKQLDNSICSINGYFKENSNLETLEEIRKVLIERKHLKNKNKKESKFDENEFNTFSTLIFERFKSQIKPSNVEDVKTMRNNMEELKNEGSLIFNGIVRSRVYLQTSVTLEEAVNAVKEDLIRTITARLELHCDSLEDDQDIVKHSPPCRVLVEHSASGIQFSEYMFPDDTPEDIVNSFKEQLGIEVSPESIINFEAVEDENEQEEEQNLSENEEVKTSSIKPKSIKPNTFNYLIIGLVGAFFILILSISIQFLMQ